MSAGGLQTRAIMSAIVTAVESAWGMSTKFYSRPATKQKLPYFILEWQPVPIGMKGVSTMTQSNRFMIVGRWPLPNDPTVQVELLKIDLANDMIGQLQTGPNFAGAGLPYVDLVDPTEFDIDGEEAFTVAVGFRCETYVAHH
jgi:hypothetical protein